MRDLRFHMFSRKQGGASSLTSMGELEGCLASGLEIEAALRRLFDGALGISFEGINNSAIDRKGF